VLDAILLAGGYGTRLRPLTYTRPKPLLPVAGRPMVDWVLDRLPRQVDHLIAAVNWQADALRKHFADLAKEKQGMEFTVVEEDEPLGTAGAVKHAQRKMRSDRFFVLNADIVSTMDLAAMLRQHEATGAVGTIALKEVAHADVVNFGVVRPDEKDPRRIRGFVEKPKTPGMAPSRLVNAGAYLLEGSVMGLIPSGRMVSMETEVFPQLLEKGFYGYRFDGTWIDVGDPARLRQASRILDPHFAVGPGADLAADCRWVDSIGGANVRVASGAVVERCVLGDGVTVQANVKLRDCIVGDGEIVGHDATNARIWTGRPPAGYPEKQVGNPLKA